MFRCAICELSFATVNLLSCHLDDNHTRASIITALVRIAATENPRPEPDAWNICRHCQGKVLVGADPEGPVFDGPGVPHVCKTTVPSAPFKTIPTCGDCGKVEDPRTHFCRRDIDALRADVRTVAGMLSGFWDGRGHPPDRVAAVRRIAEGR